MNVRRLLVPALCLFLTAQSCFAWSEGGHHLIAVMAFETLTSQQQREFFDLLKSHPRFAEDFKAPEKFNDAADIEFWMVGRAGYWPDVARSRPEYTRPSWHYQLGSTLTVGNVPGVPSNPGPVPENATLRTEQLHIGQAVELCRRVLRDKSNSKADRALALCWLAHLVADAHQPCHSGSLYYAGIFPEGDRGANSIPTIQSKNLHALWDGLLGPAFDAGDVRRRERLITTDRKLWADAKHAADEKGGLDPLTWLRESSDDGRSHVYTTEVMKPIEAVSKSKSSLEPIDLSESYLKAAGEVARKRAAFAARRLAAILADDL